MYFVVEIDQDGMPVQMESFSESEYAKQFAAEVAKENNVSQQEIEQEILSHTLNPATESIHGVFYSTSRGNASGVWFGFSSLD